MRSRGVARDLWASRSKSWMQSLTLATLRRCSAERRSSGNETRGSCRRIKLFPRGLSFVGCDKQIAGTPVFMCINRCRTVVRQHLINVAAGYAVARTGVPALAVARLSHPTLFAPFRLIPTGNRVNASPMEFVLALIDKTMERRPFPVTHLRNQFVFARIPVTVIGTAFQIVFITNSVFPISLLPDPTKSMLPARM